MSRFLPRHLSGGSLDGSNYALAHRQPLDLGLVSGPCPWDDVLRSVLSDVDHREWAGYRSPGTSAELVEAISAREGVSCDSVWITAGVDMAIEYVLGRFLEGGGRLSIVAPNFPRFAIVGGALAGVAIDYAPSVTAIEPDAGLVALCSPCNPSTDELDASAVRAAIAGHPQLLFCLDAAFSWYATWDPVDLVRQFDNVLVLKSYSKIGLAGLRLAVEWSLDRVA
jgi:histidinol-phosphate/aromatic aminotransferase/cobyric acid decarboxylase-like protein